MASRLAEFALETNGLETAPAIDPADAAAEANHRIANNLSIIAGYVRSELSSFSSASTVDVRSIRRSLQQLSLRIDAIGRLHRLLTSSPHESTVEMSAYLRKIADAVSCSLPRDENPDMLFLLDARVLLPAKEAVVIGAIVSEALFNSVKHAHPQGVRPTICLGCRRSRPGRLLIEIEDDGVSWPHVLAGKQMHPGGTGTQLMRTLARSLNAELEFADADPGYAVRIDLPVSDQPFQL
jgi:two-component sensor histidine kinase